MKVKAPKESPNILLSIEDAAALICGCPAAYVPLYVARANSVAKTPGWLRKAKNSVIKQWIKECRKIHAERGTPLSSDQKKVAVDAQGEHSGPIAALNKGELVGVPDLEKGDGNSLVVDDAKRTTVGSFAVWMLLNEFPVKDEYGGIVGNLHRLQPPNYEALMRDDYWELRVALRLMFGKIGPSWHSDNKVMRPETQYTGYAADGNDLLVAYLQSTDEKNRLSQDDWKLTMTPDYQFVMEGDIETKPGECQEFPMVNRVQLLRFVVNKGFTVRPELRGSEDVST